MVGNLVSENVGDKVGNDAGPTDAVDSEVNCDIEKVGDSVCLNVGFKDEPEVGNWVANKVWEKVGPRVSEAVGDSVCVSVGVSVGVLVGDSIGNGTLEEGREVSGRGGLVIPGGGSGYALSGSQHNNLAEHPSTK